MTKEAHHHEPIRELDDSERLPNRRPEYLCRSEDKANIVYVSSGPGQAGEGWNLYLVDPTAGKVYKAAIESVQVFDGRQGALVKTDLGDFCCSENPEEPPTWRGEPMVPYDTDNYEFIEKLSGQLSIQPSRE